MSAARERDFHHRGQPAHRQRPGTDGLWAEERADSGLPERAGQPHRGLQRAAWRRIERHPHGLAQRRGGAAAQFLSLRGMVVGRINTISGDFAHVTGGNKASGLRLSVSGGQFNTASGRTACRSAGAGTTRPAAISPSVSGGAENTASGEPPRSAEGYQHGQRASRGQWVQHGCGAMFNSGEWRVASSVSGGLATRPAAIRRRQRRAQHYPRDGVRLVGGIGSG